MKGKVEYWSLQSSKSEPDVLYAFPVKVLGRCNVEQFILAISFLTSSRVNQDIITRERMCVTDNPYELDYLYGCPLGTIFAYYYHYYNNPPGEGRNPHIYENIYGVVQFETQNSSEPKEVLKDEKKTSSIC